MTSLGSSAKHVVHEWTEHPGSWGLVVNFKGHNGIKRTVTHQFKVMLDVIKIDTSWSAFKEDFARVSH